uniref:Uncharacterized protein n=1 Tax=Physcomitrium patens TaxID=3218 RepID=A0A2K1KG27_PHYPA|nr:hypothetical protein PHYPA_009112 [Physcomitrium patens]
MLHKVYRFKTLQLQETMFHFKFLTNTIKLLRGRGSSAQKNLVLSSFIFSITCTRKRTLAMHRGWNYE